MSDSEVRLQDPHLVQQTHFIDRTSPFGTPFVGTCRLCGETDLTTADVNSPCKNPLSTTFAEALFEALDEEPAERSEKEGEE